MGIFGLTRVLVQVARMDEWTMGRDGRARYVRVQSQGLALDAGGRLAMKPPMQHRAVGRALEAISRYKVQPDQIDHAILSAINVSLCLETGGDARVANV